MILSAIAAVDQNRLIGKGGALPWHIPEDMKYFRSKTKGHILIMGRKTFASFAKPLPDRTHIVVTRTQRLHVPEGVIVCTSPNEALLRSKALVGANADSEVFVIGGGEIYSALLPQTDRLYLTEIAAQYDGDAHFPEFSKDEFKEISRVEHPGSPKYSFVVYERKRV